MRRLLLALSTVAAVALLAQPAHAQITFGAQAAAMTGIDDLSTITPSAPNLSGTFGLGARAALSPPLLPVGLIAQGMYYFPDCGAGDCSQLTYSVAGQLKIPLPIIQPYAIGGWQWRRSGDGTTTTTETGPMVGVGVQLNLMLKVFLEATAEFNDEIPSQPNFDSSPLVIKGGILFG